MPNPEANPGDRMDDGALDRLTALISASDDIFVLTDLDGTIRYTNRSTPEAARIADLVRQQIPRDMVPRDVLVPNPVAGVSTLRSNWRGEIVLDDDPSSRTFDVQVVIDTASLAMHARDISPAARLQHQLAHLASHDDLTDLPNRSHLLRRLADALERARSRDSHLAVLYVDIDDLKRVNDSAGHERGDEVISEIARRLVAATRPEDLVARIGGDEFVVLCDGIHDEGSAAELAERLRIATSGTLQSPRGDVEVGVSIGVVLFTGGHDARAAGELARSLLDEADTAMYRAKLRGKSRCEVYTETMRAADRERAELAQDLARAVERGELSVEYQPIVSPHTRRVVAAEALVRWQHPKLGRLLPSSFIDLIDDVRTETTTSLGDWVVRAALEDLRTWITTGRVEGRFAVHVNVSRSQILRSDFAERVLSELERANLQPFHLVLEFDERTVLDGESRTVRTLQSLRRRGVRLSLDDFGAGTASISCLRECPVDFVKIDGSLVRGLGDGDDDERLVRTMIQLAHGVDASAIAESVTQTVHMDRLVALGCDLVQGFLISEPVPAANFVPDTATVFPA